MANFSLAASVMGVIAAMGFIAGLACGADCCAESEVESATNPIATRVLVVMRVDSSGNRRA
jgi:hypothetical protein